MALHGFLEPSDASDQRASARRRLSLVAQGRMESGTGIDVLVHNISETGLLVESDPVLTIGEWIEIELPHAGAIRAEVVWASGQLFGCQFEHPVSPATLAAAELRSAVGSHLDVAASDGPANERFGARLQRLRAERGLSQSDLAERMGVSAPSISGWEKGRARPKHNRLADLASILDVSVSELLGDPAPDNFQDMIDRSRSQIARALGTSAEKVRIVVEL